MNIKKITNIVSIIIGVLAIVFLILIISKGDDNIEIDSDDDLILQAQNLSRGQKTLSTSYLQRRLRIGYPRAARLMDELEDQGVVGPGDSGKAREVL